MKKIHNNNGRSRASRHCVGIVPTLMCLLLGANAASAYTLRSENYVLAVPTLSTGGSSQLSGSFFVGSAGITIGEQQPIGNSEGASGVTAQLGFWPSTAAVPEPSIGMALVAGALWLGSLGARRRLAEDLDSA